MSLFNRGEFYRCHEYLEDQWREEPNGIRLLYQGILQVGVGFHHLRAGNRRGASRLLTKGLANLRGFEPTTRNLDIARLRREVLPYLENLPAGKAPPDREPLVRYRDGTPVESPERRGRDG
nr:DUF309 domain-containing protein [Rubrobacter indicoceani]